MAHAHPVPRRCHERKITVQLTPAAVVVRYRLEVDTLTIIQDDLAPFEDEIARMTRPDDFYAAFLRCYAPILGRNLRVTLDGQPLELTCAEKVYRMTDESGQPLDHMRCDFRFETGWQPGAGEHEFAFREGNYGQELGRVQLSLAGEAGVEVLSKSQPATELQSRPPEQLGPGDDGRMRNLSATFRINEGVPPRTVSAEGTPRSTSGGRHSLLDLLLDPHRGFWVLLFLAAGVGAVHALTPGHGKTLVAAYLVGERGTAWHACLLGFVTTITHTGAVLALAVALLFLFPKAVPADVQAALKLIGGLLVAGLGFWLLLRRLSGGADHTHLAGGNHEHRQVAPSATEKMSVWGLIILGISGGIVPCWDAIAMLAFAISAQRLWLALPLLLAFSAGLAGVLIAIGVAVVYLKGFSRSHWGEGPLVRVLPLVSAVLVTGLGLWLCYDSVHQDGRSAAAASERP